MQLSESEDSGSEGGDEAARAVDALLADDEADADLLVWEGLPANPGRTPAQRTPVRIRNKQQVQICSHVHGLILPHRSSESV